MALLSMRNQLNQDWQTAKAGRGESERRRDHNCQQRSGCLGVQPRDLKRQELFVTFAACGPF